MATMTSEQITKLAELSQKAASGGTLNAAETTELMALLNAQIAATNEIKRVAESAGIKLATDTDLQTARSLVEDYHWHTRGNMNWTNYRLHRLMKAYNTLAVKHGLKQAEIPDDLETLLANLPPIYQSAANEGKARAAIRYQKQWGDELAEYAKVAPAIASVRASRAATKTK